MRLTARARLALLATTLVLLAGVALTALTYVLTWENLRHRAFATYLDPAGRLPSGSQPPSEERRALNDRIVDDALSALLAQAGLALVVVTGLTAVLGWLLAGRVLRPIRAISSTARRLSAENLAERVPVTAPADELAELASTVNEMLDRIQDGVAERDRILGSQRLFTANAAHELRTPLTTVRTAIDVTLDGNPSRADLLTMTDDIHAAVTRMQRVLHGLLLLARSQAGIGTYEPVDLADIATGALNAARKRTRDLAIHTDLRPAPVSGELVLLERMIENLVDNAIRYNRPDGQLALVTGTAGGQTVLRITNTGPTIPPEKAQTLLEPFVRGHETRVRTDGSGLGLSIVRAVALAHQGQITVTTQPGGGLGITVGIPADQSAPGSTAGTAQEVPRTSPAFTGPG